MKSKIQILFLTENKKYILNETTKENIFLMFFFFSQKKRFFSLLIELAVFFHLKKKKLSNQTENKIKISKNKKKWNL